MVIPTEGALKLRRRIIWHARSGRGAYPFIATLARYFKRCTRTIRRWIAEAVECGLIAVERRGPRSACFIPLGWSEPLNFDETPRGGDVSERSRVRSVSSLLPGALCIPKEPKIKTGAVSSRDDERAALRDDAALLESFPDLAGSEAGRLRLFGAAEHATRVATKSARGLFRWILHHRKWAYITQADEDAAAERLRRVDGRDEERSRIPALARELWAAFHAVGQDWERAKQALADGGWTAGAWDRAWDQWRAFKAERDALEVERAVDFAE